LKDLSQGSPGLITNPYNLFPFIIKFMLMMPIGMTGAIVGIVVTEDVPFIPNGDVVGVLKGLNRGVIAIATQNP
jgi:hypothetical protein